MVHDPLIMTDWSCCQGTLLSTAWLVVKPVWANHQQKSPMASYTPMRQGKTHPFSTEFPNCKPLSLSSTLNLGKFFIRFREKPPKMLYQESWEQAVDHRPQDTNTNPWPLWCEKQESNWDYSTKTLNISFAGGWLTSLCNAVFWNTAKKDILADKGLSFSKQI